MSDARLDPALERALESASELVFLCSGNIVRSAFAELYLRHRLAAAGGTTVPIRSGATTYDNDALYPTTRRALEARGVPSAILSAFRPTPLSRFRPRLDPDAVVFGMTREHLAAVEPALRSADRAFLLPQLLGRDEEIADPMFAGGFEGAFTQIARCVDVLARRLADRPD